MLAAGSVKQWLTHNGHMLLDSLALDKGKTSGERNMNVKTLQSLDRWAGVPICFGLSGVRAIFGAPATNPLPPLRRLLIVKLAEQGSTVLAYPALLRAAQLVGRENLYFSRLRGQPFHPRRSGCGSRGECARRFSR